MQKTTRRQAKPKRRKPKGIAGKVPRKKKVTKGKTRVTLELDENVAASLFTFAKMQKVSNEDIVETALKELFDWVRKQLGDLKVEEEIPDARQPPVEEATIL